MIVPVPHAGRRIYIYDLEKSNIDIDKVDQLLSQGDELCVRARDRQSGTQGLLTATIHQLLKLA